MPKKPKSNEGMKALAPLLMLLLCTPALAMESVHNVTVAGVNYQVVELLHSRCEKIPKWNILRLRRGEHYREYRLLDSAYTLKIYDPTYALVKASLKGVPDNRLFNERHPYYEPTMCTLNVLSSLTKYIVK